MTSAADIETDALIACIYRAAAGELPWTDALAGIVGLFRCWGVHLFGLRPADGSFAFSHEAGFPPEALLHYVSHYHRIDPRTPMLAPLAVGEWWHCHQHFDDDFVARHPLYQELIVPYGGRYVSGAKLYQDSELVVVLGVSRGRLEGPLSDEDMQRVRRLALHVQTALSLWWRQRQARQQALAGEAILSRLSQPVLLVDAELRLHYRNAAAAALMDRNGALRHRDGRLACAVPAEQSKLEQAVRRLDPPAQGPGALGVRGERLVVQTGGRQDGLLLMLSALEPHETMGAFGNARLMLALLHEAGHRRGPDAVLVAAAFELTPAESQVAVRVAAGESPLQIAGSIGVSVHTVRSQLAAVFDKVGVRRQAELAAALASMRA